MPAIYHLPFLPCPREDGWKRLTRRFQSDSAMQASEQNGVQLHPMHLKLNPLQWLTKRCYLNTKALCLGPWRGQGALVWIIILGPILTIPFRAFQDAQPALLKMLFN